MGYRLSSFLHSFVSTSQSGAKISLRTLKFKELMFWFLYQYPFPKQVLY